MKRTKTLNRPFGGAVALLSLFFLCQSCVEDLTGQWPVIQEEMVGDYLENRPELFSEFSGMLNKSGVMGFLKAYGMYTVFAPTNEAMERYYQYVSIDKGETINSYTQLPLFEIREFCFNHIIKDDSLKVKYMHEGLLSQRSMSGRLYSVSNTDSAIVLNDYSPILARDIELHNGVIQVLGEALKPAYGAIAEVFEKDSTRFSIYVKALKATGVYDNINKTRFEDETYDYTVGPIVDDQYKKYLKPNPTSRYIGFTILAVSDTDLANYIDVAAGLPNGIHSLADLEKLARHHYGIAFNHDADTITVKTDKRHYLNRFISYHCFNRILYSSRFVKDYFTFNHYPEYPMPEYIETMMENTIVEVLLDKQGKTIGPALAADSSSAYGVFNYDDPAQRALLTPLKDLPTGGAVNGYYHGITRPLMYTKTLSDALSSKRLRMDVASFLPELTTNNMRGSGSRLGPSDFLFGCILQADFFDTITADGAELILYQFLQGKSRYQYDYINIVGISRATLKTCPIPAGTYEVRIWVDGPFAQLYFDDVSCGFPIVNLFYLANELIKPGTDKNDPEGYENDKNMRNHGLLKGPLCFGNGIDTSTARDDYDAFRRILGTYTFNKTACHFLTIVSFPDKDIPNSPNLNLDYIEFCPVSYLQKEGLD